MTGNEIGVEGAKTLSEMLRVNKTLKKLNLRGEQLQNTSKKSFMKMINNEQTGNKVGSEGGMALRGAWGGRSCNLSM